MFARRRFRPPTSDLFTELSRTADKQLWFVEAHLQ